MGIIKIELMDGRVLDNDPALGINFANPDAIEECLVECRDYWLTTPTGTVAIRREDVKRIYRA